MAKERLDVLLVNRGFFPSRERARALIMEGKVLVNERKIDKPGTAVKEDAVIRLLGEDIPFVSRGGLKLSKALDTFSLSLKGKVMADIGAATGGFTDCALQRGARKVYAIDVGYGQLAWKLRTDERVVNMERTNIRQVTQEMFAYPLDFASIDVAFISLSKVLPTVYEILSPSGEVVALIKPQFEAGREHVGKKGVVRDPSIHISVIRDVFQTADNLGFYPTQLTFSPVKGPEGNIEYLVHLEKVPSAPAEQETIHIENIVQEAHLTLTK
ncbi:TlyA family rRNA (cytidine-2'-O)-methyltransferase [Selenomonas sp. TAMA-11512]|uniref:TlyA family RNA methyltransferase n=1 Tax=Selenomonas sp. TAMA-11512 TaxID=3095337 RepID=UPI003087BF68|nr:TlyA family rRNA (cytidine-2'-O)-methyltransferase [Selenomonas sp. TAMA-11512]